MMNRKDSNGRILRTGESQRAGGRYRYTWRQDGRQREIGAVTLRELRVKEQQLKKDIYDGINYDNVTVNDIFERYMNCKMSIRQTTRENYKYMYTKYVKETFGRTKIKNVRYSDVVLFYNRLINVNKLRIGSVSVIHTVLHPVFDMAVRDNYIRFNPSDGIMNEMKKNMNYGRSHRHALTEQEQVNFMGYVRESKIYGHWAPVFAVLLGTGCRIGELLGLTREDCDFESDIISINHSLVYKQYNGKCGMHIHNTKTESGVRLIPMADGVKKALQEQWEISVHKQSADYEIDGFRNFIFVNREGHVHSPMAINRAIRRILLSYNSNSHAEPIRKFSAHNLRHTFCARLCENECNIKVIQELMGHSDIGTTMDVYAEVTYNKKKSAIKQLEDGLSFLQSSTKNTKSYI